MQINNKTHSCLDYYHNKCPIVMLFPIIFLQSQIMIQHSSFISSLKYVMDIYTCIYTDRGSWFSPQTNEPIMGGCMIQRSWLTTSLFCWVTFKKCNLISGERDLKRGIYLCSSFNGSSSIGYNTAWWYVNTC